ncbi:carboxylate--amine ligase [Phycicoccus sp. HDW14]|uniref:carboxylate--amine ligase n=1 Tax=Phycicoccus sp. HDW14 TaxID=2714941 RepID=UPI00140943EB|nr:carboxylate--amine ligase [Phycicoccus sp. HDW14]QIM22750.1 carboxylate--amine ligase [Phycicoccus sp. HDW14]
MPPAAPATDFRPVILGGDITAYTLVRTFHEAYGVRPLVVNMTDGGPIALSTVCDHEYVAGFEDPDTFVAALERVGREQGGEGRPPLLLVAAGDWYVRMIIEHKDRLGAWFTIPYIDLDLLDRIVRKDVFYGILDEVGVPYPATVVVDCSGEHDEERDLPWGFPVVAKPADSALYHYASFEGKKKVYVCDTADELADTLRRVRASSYDGNFLLQEFVPGDDTNMRVLTCYSDRDGKVRFGSVGHVLLEEHHPLAIGNPCVIITTEIDEVVEQAKRFLEHIGYVGFSNFDLKYDRRDGTYKFFEINVRLGRSNFYVTAGGHNVSEWYVRDWVRHEPMEGLEIARGEHLFAFVPKYVVKHFVLDEPLRDKALGLMKAGRASDPNVYGPDLTLKRRAYNLAYHVNQVRKFREHFTDRR